jgi:farnesyl-diphosphate farnesyltransferase
LQSGPVAITNRSYQMAARITAEKPCLSLREQRDLIGPLLRDVSRSFYLTLRVLPREIRPQISLAYVLARASDTIADTEGAARDERVTLLQQMSDGNVGATFLSRLSALAELRQECRSRGETTLMRRLGDCFAAVEGLDELDQQLIRQLLRTIITGQIFDLERFPGKPLSADELDHYTYLVAGCVGEFWTKICQAHLSGLRALRVEDGIRFGKGLQLVNILRDIAEDRRRGRQYLPEPEQYHSWLDVAVAHLGAGWQYTMAITADQKRLRLACIWPIWIGLRTIQLLRCANPLDSAHRVKISRAQVYAIMARSLLLCQSDRALNAAFRKLHRRAVSAKTFTCASRP